MSRQLVEKFRALAESAGLNDGPAECEATIVTKRELIEAADQLEFLEKALEELVEFVGASVMESNGFSALHLSYEWGEGYQSSWTGIPQDSPLFRWFKIREEAE